MIANGVDCFVFSGKFTHNQWELSIDSHEGWQKKKKGEKERERGREKKSSFYFLFLLLNVTIVSSIDFYFEDLFIRREKNRSDRHFTEK